MVGAILQLQGIGKQDIYLTQNPTIDFFRYQYHRYINFASEIQELPLNEVATFGRQNYCIIPYYGHLLSKMYLHIKLPPLQKTSGNYACWSNILGYAIFDGPIEFVINGSVVDRIYPQLLDINDELTNSDKMLGRNLMLMKSDVYVSNYYNAINQTDLVIPLDFCFTQKYNMSLPLISMGAQEIRINFKLKKFDQVINYDGTTPPNEVYIIDSDLCAEYIWLDDTILQKFKLEKHMFLINQIQYQDEEIIPANTIAYNSSLKFDNMCKELLFACVSTDNTDSNNYFAYSNINDNSFIKDITFLLDGKRRFDKLPEYYSRLVFPDCVHSTVPIKYIYSLPFSLEPEKNQPSGSLNMSRFTDKTLSLTMNPGNEECRLHIYGIMYNILIIENGKISFEYLVIH